MENADIVIALLVVLGVFSGGILFGGWLAKRIQPKVVATDPKLVNWDAASTTIGDSRTVVGPSMGRGSEITAPLSGKFQPTAPNRVGLSNLIRQLEDDDPEAKRHETIMKANEGTAVLPLNVPAALENLLGLPRKRIKPAKETNARK